MAKPLLPFPLFSLQGPWFFATLSIPIASIATLFVKRPGYDAAFIAAIIAYSLVLAACIPTWRRTVQTRTEFWMRLFIDDNTQYLTCCLILLTAPRPVFSTTKHIHPYNSRFISISIRFKITYFEINSVILFIHIPFSIHI